MGSTLNALDVINGALIKSGFEVTTDNQASTSGTYGNKCYYFLLESINILTEQLLPDAGWNEPETSTTVAANSDTITLASRVNPNIIHWVAIDSNFTRLARTTRARLIAEIFPGFSDPTTTGKPTHWYVTDQALKVWRKADASYTINYGYQNLPQTFTSSTLSGTTLDISDEARAILVGMVAYRFLDMEGNLSRAESVYNKTESLANPFSLVNIYRRNNKLMEKWALRRVQPSSTYMPRNFI